MAQEHSGAAGQEPVGYDYQQPWYPPQQEVVADPWAGGFPPQQQPYAGADQQGYGAVTDLQGYPATDLQGYPAASEQQQSWGTPGTGQQEWQQNIPQQPTSAPENYHPTGYEPLGDPSYGQYVTPEQPLYAPSGADGYTGGFYGGGYNPAGDSNGYAATDQPSYDAPGDLPPVYLPTTGLPSEYPSEYTPTEYAPLDYSSTECSSPAGEPAADDLGPGPDAGGPDAAAPAPANPSFVDRAKAAAAAVISADHAPNRRTLMIRAGAGAAALAVLITAGVLATGDDGDSAATGGNAAAPGFAVAHAKAWTAEPAAAAAGADDTLVGSWLLSDAVVRADSNGVHAYGLADGKPTWSVAPPAPGAAACGLSPTVNAAGLGAALFRPQADPKSPCTLLAAVDTKTGKTAWTKTLSDTKDAYSAHVAVTNDKVVAVGDDKAVAWAAADGKDAWQYGGQGKFCSLSGNATGATVLVHSSCADSTPVDQAVALNVTDGKVKWWRGLNNQPKTVTVLSAEPAVVLTTGENPADDRVFAWGATGDAAAEIPVAVDGGGRLDVGHGSFDATPSVFFQEHTMLTTVTAADGGTPAVTAYDVTTGKAIWKTAVGEKAKTRAIGLDNGAVLLAADERLDQPAHLSRFALAGGQEVTGGGYPKGTGSLLTSGRMLSGGGKVVVLPEHSANFGTATAFQSKA